MSNSAAYRSSLQFTDQQAVQPFICTICHGVVHDAVELVCRRGLCGHLFCRSCIQTYTEHCATQRNATRCPTCREQYDKTRDPSAQLLRRLSSLAVKCTSLDCDWKGEYGAEGAKLKGHLDQCPKAPWECPGCNALFPKSESDAHGGSCSHFPVECWHCKISFPRKDLPRHSRHACPQRTTSCPECKTEMTHAKLQAHQGQLDCVKAQLLAAKTQLYLSSAAQALLSLDLRIPNPERCEGKLRWLLDTLKSAVSSGSPLSSLDLRSLDELDSVPNVVSCMTAHPSSGVICTLACEILDALGTLSWDLIVSEEEFIIESVLQAAVLHKTSVEFTTAAFSVLSRISCAPLEDRHLAAMLDMLKLHGHSRALSEEACTILSTGLQHVSVSTLHELNFVEVICACIRKHADSVVVVSEGLAALCIIIKDDAVYHSDFLQGDAVPLVCSHLVTADPDVDTVSVDSFPVLQIFDSCLDILTTLSRFPDTQQAVMDRGSDIIPAVLRWGKTHTTRLRTPCWQMFQIFLQRDEVKHVMLNGGAIQVLNGMLATIADLERNGCHYTEIRSDINRLLSLLKKRRRSTDDATSMDESEL